jgi:cytochrome P450
MDPPKHAQMRDLVNKAFTPRAIQNLIPRIHQISQELLNQIADDKADIVSDFATPLPVIVIAELLGVPAEDRGLFKQWSDVLVEGAEDLSDEAFQKLRRKRMQTKEEFTLYFQQILAARSAKSEDDLVSALLLAEIEGERLTKQDVISFCILLLAAGNETTTNLITNGVRLLTEQPDIQSELSAQPELIPGFIEEVLRYYPPIVAIGRVASRDSEVGHTAIRKGDQIISWVGAANRDEDKFANPDEFDCRRKPNPHLSFGFGIHFCLGAPLARLEGKIAIEELLKAFKQMRRDPNASLTPIPSSFVFGVKNYPIRFIRN